MEEEAELKRVRGKTLVAAVVQLSGDGDDKIDVGGGGSGKSREHREKWKQILSVLVPNR